MNISVERVVVKETMILPSSANHCLVLTFVEFARLVHVIRNGCDRTMHLILMSQRPMPPYIALRAELY